MATQCFWQSASDNDAKPVRVAPAALRVLAVDDQPNVRFALRLLLRAAGHEAETVGTPAEALQQIVREHYDVALVDLNYTRDTTSGGEGLELVERLHAAHPELLIVVMTAWGTVDVAVAAMQRGAVDFIQKPWDNAQLLAKLDKVVAGARDRAAIDKEERDDAIAIQRRLSTVDIPQIAGCEIVGLSRSLRYIGGDCAQVTPLGPHKFAISIADVAGKGVPGALLAANLRGAERPLVTAGMAPRILCRELNRVVGDVTTSGKFVSFFAAVVDAERRSLTYANAGHNPPLIVSADGSARTLATGGAVLGVFDDWQYEQEEVQLAPGDRIVLFTDGIVEAWSEARGEFGSDLLTAVARDHRVHSAAGMHRGIMDAVLDHCDGNFQDDATLVVIGIE